MVVAIGASAYASAAVKAWCGAGGDDNMSTAANWSDGVAPASGDTLVFMGDVRTSPVNDFDPEIYSFKGIVFSNRSDTVNAAFTLKGNRIRITGAPANVVAGANNAFGIWLMNSPSTITDVIEADVDLPNSSPVGSWDSSNHPLVFKGTVRGNGGQFSSVGQTRYMLHFEGPVKNFSKMNRPNGGGGGFWLMSAENEFSATYSHTICEGTLKVDSIAAYGGSQKGIEMGQAAWNTPATLAVNAGEDTRFDGPIVVRGPQHDKAGGTVSSEVAGKTVTLGGEVSCVSSGPGSAFKMQGVGDGVFAGRIVSQNLWLQKQGAGTWTLSHESQSVTTGDVSVASGTLRIDGDYSACKNVTVSSGAMLGGTGVVNNVEFKSGSKLLVSVGDGGVGYLQINGGVQIAGSVIVELAAPKTFTPGVEYTIATLPNMTGIGTFTPGDSLPASATLGVRGSELIMTLATADYVWKGDAANNVWDFSSPNWIGDLVFVDGAGVTFGDGADEGTENVNIASAVRPLGIRVRGSRNYVFSGAGITGVGGIDKSSGGSVLTIANTNDYVGATMIGEGALVLAGTLKDSAVNVGANASFTNAVTGRITGDKSVSLSAYAFELDGTNDFTGGLVMETAYTEAEANIRHIVRNPAALGAGSVNLKKGTLKFGGGGGETGRGRLFSIGGGGSVLLMTSGASFTWLGDVEINGGSVLNIHVNNPLTFGEPGCTTTVRSKNGAGMYVRQNSTLHWYSRLDIGQYGQTDSNVTYFYSPGNKWTSIYAAVGGLVCRCENTLAVAPVKLGQIYQQHSFHPYLDLGGFDQTISALLMEDVLDTSTQTVKSTNPAILTITNDADTVTLRRQGRITGAVTLRKRGAGNWSFGCKNLSTGDVIVEGGTMTLTADDALPTASDESRLVIMPEGKVAVAEGVVAVVSRLATAATEYPAGVYGGEGCAVAGAKIRPNLFAPGAGAVRVLHGAGGSVVIIR